MKQTPLIIVAFSILLISLTSCRTSPIYNVPSQSYITAQSQYTEEDVKKAIIKAGTTLKWSMVAVKPGLITGTLRLRAHMAQVDIIYDLKKYSITYKNSTNLKYNSEDGSIHSNYNGWVQNLDNAIKTELNIL